MVKLSSPYKELLVTSPHVEFVDGFAEVDEDTAAILLGLGPHYCTLAEPSEELAGDPDEDEGTPAEPGVPAKNASTEVWRDYAESIGIDVPEDSSRAAIRELVTQAQAVGEE